MLDHIARQGLFDLELSAKGDLHVDFHHTVEDVGICMGDALRQALGDKKGIRRYGWATMPMDEALATVSLDLSGRPLLVYTNPLAHRSVGEFPAGPWSRCSCRHWLIEGAITLHASVESAENPHHAAEALFKTLGRALRLAIERDPRVTDVPSTKGILE